MIPGLKVLEPPKRCPAPESCYCLARPSGDPEPDEPESIWCMGLRKDDKFPGKERPIQIVPSDCIVSCNLIGSHSDQAGAHTTIMNVPDIHLILETWMEALDKIGLLDQVFVAAVMSRKDRALAARFEKGVTVVDMKAVLTIVVCTCEELYRDYSYECPPDGILRLIEYHATLGHIVSIEHKKRSGSDWIPSGGEVPRCDCCDDCIRCSISEPCCGKCCPTARGKDN